MDVLGQKIIAKQKYMHAHKEGGASKWGQNISEEKKPKLTAEHTMVH